ncbi:MAG: hypothetical protein KOO60_10970 [Gemmatimonadales bacterium]|nr:hypothetical protein [Gemmatimonadales bacterium]
MPTIGTEFSRAVPHIWHKKHWQLPRNEYFGDTSGKLPISGTQGIGTYAGILFEPGDWMSYSMPLLSDWDGTSSYVFRHTWSQSGSGDKSAATVVWQMNYWLAEDWANPIGSNVVTIQATYVYGDEGTTNYCMHGGTFQMDLTGGTFGTAATGQTLFMNLSLVTGGTDAGSALVVNNWVEYMAHVTGPSNALSSAQDKRGA